MSVPSSIDGAALVKRLSGPLSPALAADALTFLSLRFTATKPGALPASCEAAQANALALAEKFDEQRARAFMADVVFKAAHTDAHLYWWFAVTRCVPRAMFEREVLARIDGNDPLQRQNALALCRAILDAGEPLPMSDAGRARLSNKPTPAAKATPVNLAAIYDQIGGGARDRSRRPAKAPGSKPTSTRNAAPLLASADFAQKMDTLGVSAAVAEFLPKLGKLPEQMRILTLEALYGAEAADDVKDIIAQTTSMLPP